MRGYVEVDNVTSVMTEHDENEQDAERRGGDGKEVDGDDVANMVVQEGSPRLRWRLAWVNSVLVDGGLGDNMAQQREF